MDDHKEIIVADAQHGNPLQVEPQWEPTRVLCLNPELSVLFLERRSEVTRPDTEKEIAARAKELNAETTAAWLLTNGFGSAVVAEQMDGSPKFRRLRKLLTVTFLREVTRLLSTSIEICSPEVPLRRGEVAALGRIFALLDTKSVVSFKPLKEFTEDGDLGADIFESVSQLFRSFAQGLVTPTAIPTELVRRVAMTHIRHLPLGTFNRESVHLCWTDKSPCPFILVPNIRRKKGRQWCQGFIFSLDRQVIFADDALEESVAFLDRALASVFLGIFSAIGHPLGKPCQSPHRGGLLLMGHKNLGHGIWDELQAIERSIQFRSRWTDPPVFYVHNEGGAALYRPLEDLYPELEGCFVYMNSVQDIVDHAFIHGVQLFRGKGRFAMRATRERLTRVARHHGDGSALVPRAQQFLNQRPVLVYGLRMSNRHPVDALGFYVRLTKALLERFGRLSIIFDGMNIDPQTGGPAAPVVNGGGASDGRLELTKEMAFVEQFREATSDLPVQLQSCVGLPLRENLFWLSNADFFVSPNGGGLAKLRWALDIPGYVLTSKINFEYCTLVDAYGDNKKMQAPFTPIYMNSPEEVEDVPLQPPRLGQLKRRAIPYPENFNVAEEFVIPRICDLVKMSLHAD